MIHDTVIGNTVFNLPYPLIKFIIRFRNNLCHLFCPFRMIKCRKENAEGRGNNRHHRSNYHEHHQSHTHTAQCRQNTLYKSLCRMYHSLSQSLRKLLCLPIDFCRLPLIDKPLLQLMFDKSPPLCVIFSFSVGIPQRLTKISTFCIDCLVWNFFITLRSIFSFCPQKSLRLIWISFFRCHRLCMIPVFKCFPFLLLYKFLF